MRLEKSIREINEKIKKGEVVVLTASEMKELIEEEGVKEAFKKVDVVTTGTFGAMCSSGAFINIGHADPPIRITEAWLDGVYAYAGMAAVDLYIGATQVSESDKDFGGAHVIEKLIKGEKVHLKAINPGTDCYPRKELETWIDKNTINQAYLYNPRNCYQNYAAATNSSNKILYTYMGTLLPEYGNITYSTSGEISPLMNDPYLKTIGIGTSIFFGGTRGYIAWEGTQFNKKAEREPKTGIPLPTGATLALVGNLKEMNPGFIRPAVIKGYGISMYIGVGIPIPILSEEIAKYLSIRNRDIYTYIEDYGIKRRDKPIVRKVSYEELRSGRVKIGEKYVKSAPLSSMKKALEISNILKLWIKEGKFFLTEKVESLPIDGRYEPVNEEVKDEG